MSDKGTKWGGCWTKWGGYWDVDEGIRDADGETVCMRVGVVEFDGRNSVAISLAGSAPLAVTDSAAIEAARLFQGAVDDRDLLDDVQRVEQTHGVKEALDRAVLTNRQWQTIKRALDQPEPGRDQHVAKSVLRRAAPSSWTKE